VLSHRDGKIAAEIKQNLRTESDGKLGAEIEQDLLLL